MDPLLITSLIVTTGCHQTSLIDISAQATAVFLFFWFFFLVLATFKIYAVNAKPLPSFLKSSRLVSAQIASEEGFHASSMAEDSTAGLWVGPVEEDNLCRQPS